MPPSTLGRLLVRPGRPFSAEEQQLIYGFLKEKGILEKPCPGCSRVNTKHICNTDVGILGMVDGGISDDVYPAVALICDNCAHFQLFGAKKMGLRK